MNARVLIFDTTLRDGEQSPGCSMTRRQKLRMAHALEGMGVDIVEGGFPAASEGDFEAVRRIAGELKETVVCGLARCHEEDIQRAAAALEPACRPRIHVFIATSPIHREHKLKMSKQAVLERAVAGVELARRHCDDVEFSAEDALRTEPAFLAEVFSAVIASGAGTINVPDTVGYTTPAEMTGLITYLRRQVSGIEHAVISSHCHNDLGLAVANSLAAVAAGARQVECTIAGIGERAGNAALEEVVMALRTRSRLFGVTTGIDTRRLYPVSRMLAASIGHTLPRNKAVVGENAFAHEAGIHQHGMLSHRETYEIMRPEDVGVSTSQLVLGKHSGRHALIERVRQLGFDLDETALGRLFNDFKALADRKREVFDADIEALILGVEIGQAGPWRLESLQVTSGVGRAQLPHAAVRLSHVDGGSASEAATGDGPLEAVFKAVGRATGLSPRFRGINLRSVTEGEDAQAEAVVRAEHDGTTYTGRGLDTDVVAAGAAAFLELINRIARRHPSPTCGGGAREAASAPLATEVRESTHVLRA